MSKMIIIQNTWIKFIKRIRVRSTVSLNMFIFQILKINFLWKCENILPAKKYGRRWYLISRKCVYQTDVVPNCTQTTTTRKEFLLQKSKTWQTSTHLSRNPKGWKLKIENQQQSSLAVPSLAQFPSICWTILHF